MIHIPDWHDVVLKAHHGDLLTAIETFVYHNEPAEVVACREFRAQLQEALEEAQNTPKVDTR